MYLYYFIFFDFYWFISLVLDHINYIKDKVGVSGVGIGAEFDAANET